MDAVIRAATGADLKAIVAVHVPAFRAGNAPHLPVAAALRMTEPHSARSWRSLLGSPPRRGSVLVAEHEGAVVGVAAAGPSRDPGDTGGELYALYVAPAQWGTGHGAELETAARDHLRAAGFARAILWVLEDNGRARRFYQRRGWVPDGGRHDHMGAVAIRYQVDL